MPNLQKHVSIMESLIRTTENYVDALEAFETFWNDLSIEDEYMFCGDDVTNKWLAILHEANRYELLALEDAKKLERLVSGFRTLDKQ